VAAESSFEHRLPTFFSATGRERLHPFVRWFFRPCFLSSLLTVKWACFCETIAQSRLALFFSERFLLLTQCVLEFSPFFPDPPTRAERVWSCIVRAIRANCFSVWSRPGAVLRDLFLKGCRPEPPSDPPTNKPILLPPPRSPVSF